MSKNTPLALMALLLLLLLAIAGLVNRSRIPSAPQGSANSTLSGDPLHTHLLAHMVLQGALTADHPSTQTLTSPPDLTVEQKDNKIHIQLSSAFLQRLGPNTLIELSMSEPEAIYSPERYQRFLEDLHKLLLTLNPELHTHEDEHE